jgi:uncharacterized protein (TIGR02996 family)
VSSGAADLEALFAAVYAAPDDDAPRAVLADALQERGDPRGDFIALQLARPTAETDARAAMLVDEHGSRWLGELAPLLAQVGWERGFPARAHISVKQPSDARRLLGRPELATLHTLTVGSLAWVADLELCARVLVQPSLRRLKRLVGVPVALTPELDAARPAFTLFELSFTGRTEAAAHPWIGATTMGLAVEQLEVDGEDLAGWHALLARLPKTVPLRSVTLSAATFNAVLTRARGQLSLSLVIDPVDGGAAARQALSALPPRSLDAIALDGPDGGPMLFREILRTRRGKP